MNFIFIASAVALTNAVFELEPLTVYATRTDSVVDQIPARTTLYTVSDITESSANSLSEFIAEKENVFIRSVNANPLQSHIAMRGYGENSFGRIKIQLDGELLNNIDMLPPDLSRVSLPNVRRIEFIHGPSPVLHGDGAVAGVINILTEDLPEDGCDGNVSSLIGSYDTYALNLQCRCTDVESRDFANASYLYNVSEGYRNRSAYDIHSANIKIGRIYSDEAHIKLNGSYSSGFYEMPGALSYDEWKANDRQAKYFDDWSRFWNYSSGFEMRGVVGVERYILIDGCFSHRFRRVNWGDYDYANDYETFAFGLNPRYLDKNEFAGFESVFTVGFDFNSDIYCVKNRSGIGSPKNRFSREKYAAFLHEELFLLEDFSIVAGVRGEGYSSRWTKRYVGEESLERGGVYDAEIGFVYRPTEMSRGFLKFTRYHRSPFCDELNFTQDGQILTPEYGYGVDAGLDIDFSDALSVFVVLYASHTEDEIFYNPYITPTQLGWNGYNCNSPSPVRRLGLDAGISWEIEDFAEILLKYSGVDARFDGGQYDNKSVPLVSAHRIRGEIGREFLGDFLIKGGMEYFTSQKLMGDFENAHGELKGACVCDVALLYTPSWAEGWGAKLSVENIFDRNYCDLAGWSDYSGAYFYPSRGRTFSFSVHYNF